MKFFALAAFFGLGLIALATPNTAMAKPQCYFVYFFSNVSAGDSDLSHVRDFPSDVEAEKDFTYGVGIDAEYVYGTLTYKKTGETTEQKTPLIEFPTSREAHEPVAAMDVSGLSYKGKPVRAVVVACAMAIN